LVATPAPEAAPMLLLGGTFVVLGLVGWKRRNR
jgi:hypothetical protein